MAEQSWERLPGENSRWFQRFEAFRLMGPGRDLTTAYNRERVGGGRKESADCSGTWRKMAGLYRWRERAEAWDQYLSGMAGAAAETERLEILNSGFALIHERVRALNALGRKLQREIDIEEHFWLPDVKSIGGGEFAERVDIIRFNSALVEQFRGTLDDIAQEVGGRTQKHDLTTNGKDLPAAVVNVYIPANGRE